MTHQYKGSVFLHGLQGNLQRESALTWAPSCKTLQCTLIGRQGGRHKLSPVVLVMCVGVSFSRESFVADEELFVVETSYY